MKTTLHRLATLVGGLALAASASAQILFINFGSDITDPDKTWNSTAGVAPIADLLDFTGAPTSISMTPTTPLAAISAKGYNGDIDDFVAGANLRYAYLNSPDPAVMQFSGLNSSLAYDITFFASRSDADHFCLYSFTGATTETVALNTNGNITLSTVSLMPDVNGDILMGIGRDIGYAGNVYINAMKISVAAVPEPAMGPMLMGLLALGGLATRRRRLNRA